MTNEAITERQKLILEFVKKSWIMQIGNPNYKDSRVSEEF